MNLSLIETKKIELRCVSCVDPEQIVKMLGGKSNFAIGGKIYPNGTPLDVLLHAAVGVLRRN
jgi:hypothetical protein